MLQPLLESIAAKATEADSSQTPCVCYIGPGGSGHFVKMVHNGIEYGDMQLLGEAALLGRKMGLSASQLSELLAAYNRGPLEGFLVEIHRAHRARTLAAPTPLQCAL